jgi:phosphoribosylamine--glycine ligase
MKTTPMDILIVGGGGREHALAWKVRQSPLAARVLVAPGNAGTALEPGIENVAIDAEDVPALLAFAREQQIGLTLIGPEAPLVAGIVDRFEEAGLRCLGPSQQAAQLEGSKGFTKDFLQRHGIPTAAYGRFGNADAALAYLQEVDYPVVVKADGLAAGKGVIICQDATAARQAVSDILQQGRFGSAGKELIIEEFLTGEEASFIVLCDGENILPMASSQDHKARDNGDRGPNTGGMGAYSPAPVVTPEMHREIMARVIEPTVDGLAQEGIRYRGFLYAGLMIGSDGVPRVLEYNCRFGDPETQPILMRLRSDLLSLCLAATAGTLSHQTAEWDPQVALGVVMSAGGYPDSYRKGDPIRGLDQTAPAKVFHAGTRLQDGQVVTHGGRVLCVTALGARVSDAQRQAYLAVRQISWEQAYYRTDIGYRAVARET